MRLRSLRLRVLIGATLWITLSLVFGGYAILAVFENAALRQFDQRLSEELAVLRVAVATEPQDIAGRMTSPSFSRVYSGLYFQAETSNHTVTSRSLWERELPLGAPSALPEWHVTTGPEMQNLRLLAQSVRVPDGRRWHLGVAADLASIETTMENFQNNLLLGLIALGLTLVVAATLMLNAALRPLRYLHDAVVVLGSAASRPNPDTFPSEVAPLVRDLDRLIERNRRQRDRGCLQAAGLAHALKTPTTILAGEIQRVARGRDLDLAAAQDALVRLQEATALHLDHAVTGPEAILPGERIEIMGVLRDLTGALERLHRDVVFSTQGPDAIYLAVTVPDFHEMLGNLIENAAQWSCGRVQTIVSKTRETVTLMIEDNGPGLPVCEYEHVFERGVRLDRATSGSGLGLTIARDVAGLYGGTIELETAPPGGGLRATLTLPLSHGLN
ncbi:HAMP domain-containing histidine kinase [Octadecabacter sp. G9-8]|uniref:histidine kinase n=1 Tax=Octadecabacter dasysiphoniae TaxID=2909341 RepID=A0ABS9CV97_9RHOB|nr:HAMP domain-containing sensor histidine kinase [Octadecabacter dasysiphoniae]MCF2870329.1 HAMP domain-containing histidine kinase [Octadecabacter dasysiphoniae]